MDFIRYYTLYVSNIIITNKKKKKIIITNFINRSEITYNRSPRGLV